MLTTVIMTTYIPEGDGAQRYVYACKCLSALKSYLYGADVLHLHIADDGSPRQDLVNKLVQRGTDMCGKCSVTISKHNGIGASLNLALSTIKDDDLWLYTTDDWQLLCSLNLEQSISLITDFDYDIVRLGPIHPNLSCKTMFNEKVGWWLDIDHRYGYAFATRPFIATKKFYNKIGPFDEGLNAYETERLYTERVAKERYIKIAQVGIISLAGPWQHIGEFEVGDMYVH